MNPKPPVHDDVLTLEEVAEMLLVSDRTVRRWRDAGTIPFVRLPNGRTRFKRSDIEAWLSQRSRGSRAS